MKKLTSLFLSLMVVMSMSATTQRVVSQGAHSLRATKVAKTDKQQLQQRLATAMTANQRDEITYKFKTLKRAQQRHQAQATKAAQPKKAKVAAQQVTIERYNYFISAGTNILYFLHNDTQDLHFDYDFPLAANAHQLEYGKTYTLADMNAEGCGWSEYDADDNLVFHAFTAATFCITKGNGYDIHIAATATDDLGNEYTFAYDEQELIPTGEVVSVNVERPIASCDYNTTDHSWLIRAQDKNYNVQLQLYSNDSASPAGTYVAADVELSSTYIGIQTGETDEYDDPITRDVYAKDASVIITSNEDRINVSGSMVGDDGVIYSISLFYAIPKAETKEDFVAHDLQVDDWAFEIWGEVQVFASTDDGKSLSLDLYGDQNNGIPGTYPIDGRNGGTITVDGEQYDLYSGSVTITYADDEYSVSGTILCWNNVEYTLNLSEPEVVTTPMSFNGKSLVLDIYPADNAWQIIGYDNDSAMYLYLAAASDQVAGHYTTEILPANTALMMVGGDSYTFLSGDVTVLYVEKQATVTGKLLLVNGSNKYDQVELTLNVQAGPYVPSVRDAKIGYVSLVNVDKQHVGYSLLTESGKQLFNFLITVDLWMQDVELNRDYTLADMDEEESSGMNADEREYIYYESVSFNKTEINADSIALSVNIIDYRGNTWNLSYAGEKPGYEGLFVDLGQANPITHADGGIEYELVDADNTLSCHLVLPGADEDAVTDSLYTSDEGGIDLEISYLSIQQHEYKIVAAALIKEVQGDEVWVSADVTDERGFKYMLRYYDSGFSLTGDTILLKLNAELETTYWEDYYELVFYAETDSVAVNFSVNSTSSEVQTGEYDVEDVIEWSSHIDFRDGEDEDGLPVWQMVGLKSVEYFAIGGEEGHYTLDATVVGEDGNVYVVAVRSQKDALDALHPAHETTKRLENGVLIIRNSGHDYNAQGILIR